MIPLKDDAPRVSTPYVNYTLIVLNTLVFLFELSLGRQNQQFVDVFGVVPARLTVVLFNHGYVPWDLVSQLGTRYVPPHGGHPADLHLDVSARLVAAPHLQHVGAVDLRRQR